MSKNTSLSSLINYVSANSSGNVTIAAPSSGYALDVTGTGRFTGALASTNFILSGGTGNTGLYYGHTDRVVLANYTAGGIDFETNGGTINMTLFPSGNLGVGASLTDAGYKLDVAGTGRFTGALSGTSATFSGFVGIGASASYNLDVVSTSDASLFQVKSTATANNTALRIGIDANTSFINATGSSTGILELRTYGTPKLTIQATGAATFSSSVTATGFETTAASNGKFGINQNGADDTQYRFFQFSTSGTTYVINTQMGAAGQYDIWQYDGGWRRNFRMTSLGAATFSSKIGVGGAVPNYSVTAYNSANGTTAAFGGTVYGVRIDNGGTFSSGRSTIFGVDSSFYGSYQPLSIEASSLALNAVTGGNVGIGATDPNVALEVVSSGVTISGTARVNFRTLNSKVAGNYKGVGLGYDTASNTGVIFPETYSGGNNLAFWGYDGSTWKERVRINTNGSLLVNRTADTLSDYGWTLNSGGGGNTAFAITNNEAFIYNNLTGGTYYKVDFRTVGTSRGNIYVTDTAVTYNTSSDYRLKKDLKSFDGLNLVNQINAYDYQWKEDNTRSFGVLAHELAEVLPYAVQGVKDGDKMQSVDYSKIVPVMVQAIKDLKAELDTLKNK